MEFKTFLYWVALFICIYAAIRILLYLVYTKTHTTTQILNNKFKDKLRMRLLKTSTELYEEIMLSQYLIVRDGCVKDKSSFICLGDLQMNTIDEFDPYDFAKFKTIFKFPFVFMKDRDKKVIHLIIFKEGFKVDLDYIGQTIFKPTEYILRYTYNFDTHLDNTDLGTYFESDKLSVSSLKKSMIEFLDIIDSCYLTYNDFLYDKD